MQVTTGQSSTRAHLLFRISCVVVAIIALATFLLIWAYRGMEMRDLLEHDKEAHLRLGGLLAGPGGQGGALDEEQVRGDYAYILSRSLYGANESSARLFCPHMSRVPLAEGGAPRRLGKAFSDLIAPSAAFAEILDDSSGELEHVSSWPTRLARQGPCRVEIMTNLGEETRRIQSRSYQIALSSAILEGLLTLALLWIARRGDERLVESEKEQNAMESELFFLANYDTLTHLPNRALFWERLDAAIGRAERLGKAVCLVLVDLRGFSKLNEEHGRTVGDRALVESARRVQASARSSDLVCRLGSDEFAVLLEDLDPERAVEAALRLSAELDRHFAEPWLDSCPQNMACNCGASLFPHDGANSEDLLSCAQQASKSAKDADEHLLFYRRPA